MKKEKIFLVMILMRKLMKVMMQMFLHLKKMTLKKQLMICLQKMILIYVKLRLIIQMKTELL